jgi:hypothetical protein
MHFLRKFGLGIGLFLLLSSFSLSAAPLAAVVSAREKLVERKRSEALQILLSALQAETSAFRRDEIEAELAKVSQIFLTNEGQRLFEMAESSRHAAKSGYLAQYEEALKLEPQNSKILSAYILALISNKKCRAAAEQIGQLDATDPYLQEIKLLKFKQQICLDVAAITMEQETELESQKELMFYKKTLRAQVAFNKGQFESALNFARAASRIDDRYATPYYWAWKILAKDNAGVDEAQRFLSLCKNISPEMRRKYSYDPEICSSSEEVEDFLRDEEAGRHAQ